MNETPAPADFASRLDLLLSEVPSVPGGIGRFTVEDAIAAVARVVDGRGGRRARAIARSWLDTARGPDGPSPEADRPALEALASLFRVPAEFFIDASVTETVRRRLRLAHQANDRGLRVIGPCRTRYMSPAMLFALHQQLLERTGQVADP